MCKRKNSLLNSIVKAGWWMIGLLFVLPFFGYLPHPTLLLTGIAGAIQALWQYQNRKSKPFLPVVSVEYFAFLLAIAFFLSGVASLNWRAFSEGTVRALLLMLYFPFVALFRHEVWRERASFALQFSGGIAAFLGIFQYFRGEAPLKWVDIERFSNIGGRVTGGFGNPNVFSVYLLLILPISLVMLFRENEPSLSRVFSFLCLCVELLCLILTWSRGAWLGAMLEILLFFLLFSRHTRKCLMIGIIPAVAATFFLPANIINRFQSIGNLNESSIRYRIFVWRGTWEMICDHPFGIGLGYENFTAHYLPYAVKGTETVIHSHQILLQILCELGFIGLVLFLSFLGGTFYCLIKGGIKSKACANSEPWSFCGGLSLLGALAAGMFDHIWYHYGVFCLFWIVAASASSDFARERSKKAFDASIR